MLNYDLQPDPGFGVRVWMSSSVYCVLAITAYSTTLVEEFRNHCCALLYLKCDSSYPKRRETCEQVFTDPEV